MQRRTFLKTMVGTSIAATTPLTFAKRPKRPARPNILFIMADDHGKGAISAYNPKSLVQTPGIDRLAKEGMTFHHALDTTSLCAPSRAAILTGRYSCHNGFFRNGNAFNRAQLSFPKLLQKAGYQTAIIGKWHLKTKPAGFDHYDIIPGQGQFFNCPFRNSANPWPKETKSKGYLTDVITAKTTDWIANRDKTKPFMLMVHHKAPHGPHHYPKRFEKLFAKDLPYPATFDDDFATRPTLKASRAQASKFQTLTRNHLNKPEPKGLSPAESKRWAYQTHFKGYFRLVTALDENIAKTLKYLDDNGLADNTIVVYTSDNGFFLGDHGMMNKMWFYEESVHVPLLVRYPGKIKTASENNDLVSVLDFAPTLLDYADAKPEPTFQGRSIRPLLKGAAPADWRAGHYYHYYDQHYVPGHYGMRTQAHKILHYYKSDQWELFDLVSDPAELKNLANSPEHKELFAKLRGELFALKTHYGDTSDKESKPVPQPMKPPLPKKKPRPAKKK